MFGSGGKTIDLAPFLGAVREAQQKGEGAIADFESIANQFAALGQDNYNRSEQLYGSWKYTMDSYYSNLNENEFGAQAQQQMLQQQEAQYDNVRSAMTTQGINPGSAFLLDTYDQSGMQGAAQQGQAQIDSKYAMYNMQNNWNNYGIAQQANDYSMYGQGVNMAGQQANAYTNMYAGQANNAMQLMQQQQQYNQAAEASGGGMLGTIGSLAGIGIGAVIGGPAGAAIGSGLGQATGTILEG